MNAGNHAAQIENANLTIALAVRHVWQPLHGAAKIVCA
jgi:hypothetical protein